MIIIAKNGDEYNRKLYKASQILESCYFFHYKQITFFMGTRLSCCLAGYFLCKGFGANIPRSGRASLAAAMVYTDRVFPHSMMRFTAPKKALFLLFLDRLCTVSRRMSDVWNGAIFTNQDIIFLFAWINPFKCRGGPHRSKCGRFSENLAEIRVPKHLEEPS
jgi:hypothetical protein